MPKAIQGFPFVFYGEVFNAYLADDRQCYLPLQDVCQVLGLNANVQRQRIQRDEVLSGIQVNIKKIVNPAQARLLQEVIAAVVEAKHAKTKKPEFQCFAEVHEEFKSAFQAHIYSIFLDEQLKAATTFLGSLGVLQPRPAVAGNFRGIAPAFAVLNGNA